MEYKEKIRYNIMVKGNSYGEDIDIVDDNKTHEVILHRGCTSRFREGELIDSVVECLKKKNIDFEFLSDETCCGVMLYILDDDESADKVVADNIRKFHKHGVKKIITMCPGCYESFHDYYTKNPDFDIEVIFAMDYFEDEEIDGTGYIIHDPCHALERNTQVRSIVKNVPEERANSCCGFGAGMKAGSKELTKKMAQQTLSGDKVITYCPSCYHTLNRVNSEKTVDFFTMIKEQL